LDDIDKLIVGFFMFGLAVATILLLAPLLLWGNTAFNVAKVDSETVNGILTVSGIVFGFQFAFFKAPKGKARALWVFGLISQVILLAFTSSRYVADTISYGYLTTNTLLVTNFNFAFILLFTIIFAILDWVISRD
jgi:hypothetical protein